MNPDVAVFWASFEQQHRVFAVRAQAVGKHTSGRAGTDDDIVEFPGVWLQGFGLQGFGQCIASGVSLTDRPVSGRQYSREMPSRIAVGSRSDGCA